MKDKKKEEKQGVRFHWMVILLLAAWMVGILWGIWLMGRRNFCEDQRRTPVSSPQANSGVELVIDPDAEDGLRKSLVGRPKPRMKCERKNNFFRRRERADGSF